MKDCTNGGCQCTPNQSISCTVNNCAHHCQDSNYCGLTSIRVGTHEANPTEIKCTDCQSFDPPAEAVHTRKEGGVMASKWPARIAGGAAGLANGLFGGGGGMVFLPILSRWGGLKSRQLYATCVAVIFPVCAVSAAIYLWRGGMNWASALPYLVGGLLGGWLGGKLYGRVSTKVLKWIFAAFLFYAGVRYLL